MKIEKINLPDEIFGIEMGMLTVFIPLLVVIFLVVISINLVLLPRIDDYGQMTVQLKTLESKKQELVQKKAYLLSVDQGELKKDADYMVNALLPQKNSYLLVGMVGKIIGNYGYQIDSFLINPGEVAKKDDQPKISGVAKVPVSISIVGPADKYLDLIKGLESSLPVLSLDSFEMRNDSSAAKMTLTISANYIEADSTFDVNKLTLADLTLTKDESNLITKLSQFTMLGNAGGIESGFNTSKSYVKYNRTDPFNP